MIAFDFQNCRNQLFLIAGPCVIESESMVLDIASEVKKICQRLGITYVFKASFDKANRSSISSFRGPGLEEGLEILSKVRNLYEVPVLTDIHWPEQAAIVADAVDILQIPAFLCRQTDLLAAAGETGKIINVKKGQFLSPWDVENIVDKLKSTGNEKIILTERGASFGYRHLVVDMKGIPVMQKTGCPVVFDATHSVQLPGGLGTSSGGMREFIPTLAKAAVAAGADGVFMEVHPDPDKGLSDAANMWPLAELEPLLQRLLAVYRAVR